MYSINKERLIETFLELVRISSPSMKEQGVIKYLTKRLKKLGIKTTLYPCLESHNLYAYTPGNKTAPSVLLSTHMDTVIPCENVNPVVTKKKITTDGTTILGGDDKAAIAMILESLEYLKENKISHGPIELLFSCAEEMGLVGIKNFDLSVLKSKKAFVFDAAGSIGKIILKAPHHSTMNIHIKGRAAHAGMEPEKGLNAIVVLSEIISALPSGRLDEETTTNIGTIHGGTRTNIVAEDASCKLELRAIDSKKLKKIETHIKDTVKEICTRRDAKFKIQRNLEYPGYSVKESDAVAQIAKSAIEIISIKPSFEICGGGSDTNILSKAGIKAINLSCGMERVHSTKEYIEIRDLVKGTHLTLAIIEKMKGKK